MVSKEDADKIDQWLTNFQKEHDDIPVIDDDIIWELACALCDDTPLGYEASYKLAYWLFRYLHI